MPRSPFGNDPAKIERYRAFWKREAGSHDERFSRRGHFPSTRTHGQFKPRIDRGYQPHAIMS